MNCLLCGKPVVLLPSAKERADKYGKPASYYTNLFKTHNDCELKKRDEDTSTLMYKLNKEYELRKSKIRKVPKP